MVNGFSFSIGHKDGWTTLDYDVGDTTLCIKFPVTSDVTVDVTSGDPVRDAIASYSSRYYHADQGGEIG